MNRRDFIEKFSRTAAVAGAGAVAAYPRVREGAVIGAERLRGELKALSDRIDDLDESQRRMMKMLLVAVSLSTGFDALTLLKGDLL